MLVTVEDGRAVKVAGDPDHPFTRGFLCTKVARYIERTYHEDRLLFPQIRTGAKGAGEFRRASWDEALGRVAEKLNEIRFSSDGPQAILPYSYAGTMGLIQGSSMDRRFFHSIGASLLDRTICASAGTEALNYTYGVRMGTDPETVDRARLIILWGSNTLTSNPHLWPLIVKAKGAGARTISIDPRRTRTSDSCDEHIAIRPGTDAALALAIMHVIFRDGLEDRDYLESMTFGWEKLRERALTEYTPARVSSICRIPSEVIERLAHEYAATKPTFIRINYGLQRHAGGGSAVRAISLLPAVTGAWRDAGGGFQLTSSGTFHVNGAALERPDLIPRGTRTVNMSAIGDALLELNDPPVRALVVYNSNPATIAPDRARVLKGLAREDLFTVVLEHFQTDTADWADIVLPATTQLEHWDLHLAYGHHYASLNRPSIAPLGEALPNTEIFRRIAARMGMRDAHFQDDDLTLIRQALDTNAPKLEGVTLETLLERGWTRLNVPTPYLPYAEGEFATPSGKCEFHSQRLAEMGLDPLPTYIPPYESVERDPSLVARYPLTLISSPAHTFLNTTFANITSLRRQAREPEVLLHPADAERRGIAPGMRVTVHNDRGAFSATARVEPSIREGVAWAPSIWWGKLAGDDANANQTRSQRETDLGHGPVFYDNQVEVEAA